MWWLKRSSSPHLCARYLMLFCTVGFVLLPTSYVWANPAGEAVVGGAATFQRDGNKLTVNQATDRLAVNWQSFNIAAGERTHFNMPSSTSAALNRVIGGNPSSIYGSLSANGILYLINPSGILVGPGGTVNAAAFMASTLDVSTEQFMNAKNGAGMNFYGSSGESIINQGNITAEKGDVFLIAQKVENRGTINAANGTAGMVGSGQNTDVMVHEVGGKGFAIRVAQLQGEAATGSNRDLPDGEELLNEGEISAAQAELNASGNVYALAIRNSGTIRAKAVVANADGSVRLDGGLGDVINTGKMYAKNAGDDATAAGGKIDIAGQNITASPESIMTAAGGEQGGNGGKVKIDSADTTLVQGKVDVTAPSAAAKGGKVELLGERVGLLDEAKVDASGGAGGGTVLVGGDYLGGRAASADLKDLAKQETEPVKNAMATVMADTAEIKADATVSGDGGKIILWSDEYTGFYGDLFARGGVEGGNGGFIETSSKNNLQAFGSANAAAANGKAGLWLLDPANVNITAATASMNISGGNPNVFTPTADNATINVATIANALLTANVVINTEGVGTQNGDITLSSALTVGGTVTGNETTLTLNAGTTGAAGGTITINNTITGFSGNKLNVVLNAAGGAVTLGNFAMTTQGGSLAVNAGGNVNLNGALTTGGGQISVVNTLANGSVTLANTGSLTSGGGNITINTGSGGILLTGNTSSATGNVNLNTTGGGTVTINGTLGTANGNLAVAIAGAGAIAQTGAITTGTGTASFTTGGATITLANPSNIFGGAVSLRNSGSFGVSLVSNSALVMGAVNVGGGTVLPAVPGTLALTFNGNLTQQAGTTITTGGVTTLTATGANRTVNLAPATGSTANSFGANFAFSGASNIQDFSLRNLNGITITELSELSSLRNLAVTFDSGNMTLPTFSASGNVVLTTSAAANTITLNNVSVGGNFTVAAGPGTLGAISQTANTTIVTGQSSVTTLTAGSGGINLFQSGNDFKSTVNLSTAAGGLANITDLNAIVLGAVSINGVGALTVTADSITQATTGSITTGSGAITMNGQTGVITLANSGNNFGTSTLSLVNQGSGATTINYLSDLTLGILNLGSGGLTVTSTGNLNLGTGTVAGPLNATASNASITQGAAGLTVTGLSTLAAGSGNITLASSGNTFGNVTINSATDVNFANAATTAGAALFPTLPATLGNLTLSFANSLTTLPGLVTTGNLTVTSGLNLTQSAALTVGGAASFNSTSGSIDLTTSGASNNFGTSVAFTTSGANDIRITDAGALILGNITMSALSAGTLSVNAGGNLTQSVGTSITTGTGAVTLNLGSAGNIILDNVANSFNGNVNFTGSYNDITVRDSTSFAIQSGLNVPGNFSLTVLGGSSITQLGAVTIVGTGSFTASNGTLGGSILLDNASNNFGTSLNLTNLGANDISIRDVGTLVLGSVSMAASAGALTVQAGGNLTQLAGTSIIAGTGAVSLTANAGGSIILTEATNNFRGNVTFSNGLATISLLDTSSFQIQNGLTLAAGGNGNFTLTAAGISQAGAMSNSGITTLTSTGVGNDIVLASAVNDFSTVRLTSGRDATIVDANSVNIGTSDVTRDLSVTATAAGGNTIVNAPVTVGGNAVFTAGTTGLFQVNTTGSNNGSLGVTGNATVTSSAIDLLGVLAGANVFLLPSTDATTVGINSTSTFSLATSELLNIVSGGTVTVGRSTGTGAITVGGLGAFDLSATSYDLTLEGLTSAIAFSNGITMGNGRTLNLAAGGAITSGLTGTDITIGDGFNSGTLSISSASTVGISGNELSMAIDNLGASTVTTTFLSNSRALQTTGAIGVTGNLNLTTAGTVSQTAAGAVTVSGDTAITVPTGSDVLMADAANNLGALTLTASGGSTFRDLELRNISASATVPTVNAIRNVVFNFDNAGVALPTLTLTGTLDVTTGGGAITQTGILNIAGDSSFASTGFGITLGNIGNIFGSNVSLTTTGLQNATLVDSTALVLGTSNVSALLDLTSGGSITQATGTTLTTGAGVTASFTTAESDLLLSEANSISGQVAFGGALGNIRDVSIQNSSTGAEVPVLEGLTNLRDLTLNYTGVTPFEAPTLQGFAFLRNISFSAVGPITQKSGGISNLGTASFTVTGAGNAITLDDALNNFGTSTDISVDKSVSLNSNNGDGTLLESSGLVLGTSNLGSGDLSVTTTAGTTTQTGIITASQFDINAGGSVSLGLSNLINTVAANVTGVGNSFSFGNAKALIIGTAGLLSGITTAAGDVSVSTAPSIVSPSTGLITVGNAVFAGGAGSVFINAQSNGNLLINADVGAAGAGTITLLAENNLATGGTGVLIGSVNTGAIVMRADSAQSDAGTLTIAANDIVGSTLNSSDYTLSGANLVLTGIVRQSGLGAKITLTPTLATGTVALGVNTAFGNYGVAAGELLNIQSAGTVVVGGSNYLGNISLGDLNLVGNVFKNFLLQSSPGGLTTVGSAASTGTFSLVSSGVDVEIDSRVQLDGNNLNISMTGGNNSLGADVVLRQEFLGGFFTALLNGGLIVNGGTGGNVEVNGSLGISEQLGLVSITGNDVTVNAIDTNGGVISLEGSGDIKNRGNLNSTAREDIFAPAPPAAGSISLTATGAGKIFVEGSIITRGAQGKTVTTTIGGTLVSIDQAGGAAGNVQLLSGELGEINVGGPILAYGGDSVVNTLSRGPDGTITIDGYNVGLTRDQIAYYGTKFDIMGRNNLIFASQPNYVVPTASIGGASITMNQLENGTAALNDPNVVQILDIQYGETGAGQLYMGSGSSIQMFGGDISVDRMLAPTTSLVGGMTLGEIYTTGRGISSGNVSIGSAFNAPVSVNYIDTSGGNSTATSTSSQSGISGGSVSVYGTAVRIGEVNTTGSSPLSTARVPAIGGAGGSLSVNATTVSILGNLSTSGGVGAGATGVRSTGGSGGEISITAPSGLTLDSVNLSTPTFVFDSSGSTGVNGGLSGSAGKIRLEGPIGAAAGGVISSATTAATSLDLRFSGLASTGTGSVVTLGTTSSDTIILGTLITAGGSGVTRGTFTVNGALQVDTLSTAAQPYSIAILGNGSVIQNRVTFLNSGTATIGAAGVTTTFTDGFDAQTGATVPSALQLGGTINTVTATSGSMLAGTTVLIADTTLNSAGNIIEFGGTLDGSFNLILTLASGLTGGTANFNGAVGDTTQVGQIRINGGVDSVNITRGNFLSTVKAIGITSLANSSLTFNKDVTLSGGVAGAVATNLGGTVTFNNVPDPNDPTAVLSFLGAGANTFSGATTLEGGPIEFGGVGAYTFDGAVTGSQNMILAGGGAKIFNGTVSVGSELLGITQADEAGNTVRFNNTVTTAGVSTFNRGVTLGAMTFNSGGATTMNAAVTIAGAATLQGAGGYQLNGAVDGASSLTLSGAGAKTFSGAVGTGTALTTITQANDSGLVTFAENVTMSGAGAFSANLVLDGMVFTAGGVTTMNGVTLSSGLVTLAGAGNYTVNGAMTGSQQLALQGALTSTKTFASTVSVTGFTQDAGSGTVTFQQNVTTTGVSSLGASTVLDGMVFSAGGFTTMNGVTLSTGAVTLQGAGAYAIGGAVTGDQNMILGGNGAKTFDGTVSVGSALLGITQADAIGNTVRFNNTDTTAGVSTFNRGVTLGTMTFNSGGATTMKDAVTLEGAAILQGAGSYTVNGAVGGGQNLTLAEAGTKTFNSTLNLGAFSQAGGKVSLGGGVTTSGAVNLASVATTAAVVVNSTAEKQTYGTVVLGGNLTTQTTLPGDPDAVTFGGVTGSGDLTAKTAGLALNGVVANSGTFSAETSGNIDLGGSYLTAIEVARIASTGGARFKSLVGDVTAQNLTTSTSLSMQALALNRETTVNGVIVNGALNMESGGAVNFNGADSTVSSLGFTGTKVSSDGSDGLLANIVVPSLGGITLTGGGNGLSYSPDGNLNVSGRISVNGAGIELAPSGNFVNSYAGNPFTANSTRILTKDLFSSWPSNGAVPGLQVVYGVNSIGQLSANQIGVSTTLLAGNAAPYILEFTTGTGQPYILAQQTAIPPVMLPAALTGGNGFARSVTYSADEIEMMTPEERSAYENQQRQVSARVILQGQSGVGEEIGAPTEGRTPQAATPAALAPVAPTAQVLLEGKPLAGAKSDQERGDATKIIKLRPTRAVALRPSYRAADVMESERMAAEVSVGAAPVAQSR